MNSKIGFGKILSILCAGFFLISCGTAMVKGEKWLDSKKDKPEINISGNWISPEWGAGMFKQAEREVAGTLGDYPAKGVVSGRIVYLMMYSGDKVHYFAELKSVDNNTLQGSFSKYFLLEEVRNHPGEIKPMSLKRVSTAP